MRDGTSKSFDERVKLIKELRYEQSSARATFFRGLNETIETSTDRLKYIKSTLDDFMEKINILDTGEQSNQTDRPQASKARSKFDVSTSTIAYKKEQEDVREMINKSRRAEINSKLEECKALEAKIEALYKAKSIDRHVLRFIKDKGIGNIPEIKELPKIMDDFYRIEKDILHGVQKNKDITQKIASIEEDIGTESIRQKREQLEQDKEADIKISNTSDDREIDIKISNTRGGSDVHVTIDNSIDGISGLLDVTSRRLDKYKEEYRNNERELAKNEMPPEERISYTNDMNRSLSYIVTWENIAHNLVGRLDKEIKVKTEENDSRVDKIEKVTSEQLRIIDEENKARQAELTTRLTSLN